MIINYKETRVLVLPKILSDLPEKKGFQKTRRLICGYNEVNDGYWVEAKKHKSIKSKLESGLIEEVIFETEKSKKLQTEIDKIEAGVEKEKAELDDKKKSLRKVKDKAEKAVLQEEIENKTLDIQDKDLELDKKKIEYSKEVSDYLKLTHKQKEKLIKETFDIEVLNKWKDSDDKAECRNLILDRIAEIKKSKVDANIGVKK